MTALAGGLLFLLIICLPVRAFPESRPGSGALPWITVDSCKLVTSADDSAHDFSVEVSSTNSVPIVAERPMYFDYHGWCSGGDTASGRNAPAYSFYFAEGTTRPGFDTWLCVGNPSTDEEALVTITHMRGDGTTARQDINVPPNSRRTVSANEFLGSADDSAHDFSVEVSSTNSVPIVAERPMYFDYHGWCSGGSVGY